MSVRSSVLGFPRIGANRELKRSLESYWRGRAEWDEVQKTASELRNKHWAQMKSAGIDHIPSNDFSLYDQVLDMAVTVGAIPPRFRDIDDPVNRYFAMARGLQDRDKGVDVTAMEMTKWFDTNYHYIVPELESGQGFKLNASKALEELKEARDAGIETRPVFIGPVTFLLLSKMLSEGGGSTIGLLDKLLPVYEELLSTLASEGVEWVQIDEPHLVMDLSAEARDAYKSALPKLAALSNRPKVMLATYFGSLQENMPLATESGFEGLHVDLVRAPEQLEPVVKALPDGMALSVGVVDGRNIWRTNLDGAHALVNKTVQQVGADRVLVGPSCSLLHSPFDLDLETKLDGELKSWMAFSVQKLDEIAAVAQFGDQGSPDSEVFKSAWHAIAERSVSPRTRNQQVRERASSVDDSMLHRDSPFAERAKKQSEHLKLPDLPTTTIGSFPQTREVRRARADWRAGKMSDADYDKFVKDETRKCIELQDSWGLDVLAHGEFERNDMVEFFGEQLAGFAFTENGWVQSYGSRCVKPPVLFGDVERPQPMTVEMAKYAQSLTDKPVKGMLTGPVTILQWSFVRDDQPRSETCMQVALALRDEVVDLESAGIRVIQVDEPAIREGLPLRKSEQPDYISWAVRAFRLATSGVKDETQIHTHMCYSEFGEMLKAIADMDADALSIETSRSHMELLGDFQEQGYPNDVGPGVYDIHSPRVPTVEEMVELLERASESIPKERLWVNPDCGLKTRGWPEVEESLKNMVSAAKQERGALAGAR